MSCLEEVLAGRSGKGYTDVIALILCVMLILALPVEVLPVFIAKQRLDTFTAESYRETEIAGRIGSEANREAVVLREKTGLNSEIHWSTSDRIRLNGEVTVRLTCRYNLGLFGGFSSFPITLRATATGKSKVYWK